MAEFSNEKYSPLNQFGVSFNSYKIRYTELNKKLDNSIIKPNDKVNVFINFESVMTNLSMIKDIESKLLLERKFPIILECEMINLCAHYRRFFRDNNLYTRVFLFYTDLTSDNYSNYIYNDDYRSYYTNKYMENPKFQLLGNKLVDKIIPRVQTILEFIPGVYFIKAKDIEGSLVPLIISQNEPEYKNVLITGERYDCQYFQYPNSFNTIYIKRNISTGTLYISSFEEYLKDLFKEDKDDFSEKDLYKNKSFYSIMMSVKEDRLRSIDSIKGFGCKTISKLLQNNINNGLITKDTNSLEMILNIFSEEHKESLRNNFNCIDFTSQMNNLTEKDKFNIISQIVDRSDYNSLIELNKKDYIDFPLMLPELTQ